MTGGSRGSTTYTESLQLHAQIYLCWAAALAATTVNPKP